MDLRDVVVRRWPLIWLLVLAAISAAFIVTTILYSDPGIQALGHFSLLYENNFAAWWSGVLLLLAALHAFDGYLGWKRERPARARGWAALSLILVALSADEIASFHERVGAYSSRETWLSLLPFALVLAALAGFAVLSLWSGGERRWRLILALAGFALFGFTALQEYIEHFVAWEQAVTPGIRTGIEEGTELTGILLMIGAVLPNTRGIFKPAGARSGPVLAAPFALRGAALALTVAAAPIFVHLSSVWYVDDLGRPADWLAVTLFFLAAVAAAGSFLRTGQWRADGAEAVAGGSLLASAVSTGLDRMRPYALLAAAAVIVVGWLLAGRGRWRPVALASGVLLAAIALRLAIDTPDVHFLTPIVAGAIVFWMNTRLFDPGAVREAEAGAEARQGVGRGEGLPPPGNDSALAPNDSITQKGTFRL